MFNVPVLCFNEVNYHVHINTHNNIACYACYICLLWVLTTLEHASILADLIMVYFSWASNSTMAVTTDILLV